jgi:hypothetical protein
LLLQSPRGRAAEMCEIQLAKRTLFRARTGGPFSKNPQKSKKILAFAHFYVYLLSVCVLVQA